MGNVFLSGASRGIGKGIALTLAKAGYNLALCCVNNIDMLTEYATTLSSSYHVNVKAYALDVSKEEEWNKVVPNIIKDFGTIDIVINNAGISYIGLITDMTGDDWNKMIATNLNSVFYSTKAFLPSMIKNKSGRLINISSMWGERGASCEVAYSTTKGGINSFTKSLAKEVAPSNISVNAIACGVIDTDMNSCFTKSELDDLTDEIPACRMGTPKEVGDTVLSILNSPIYMTGQIIGLDGGI
ncbi:MAG: SDR family oxidoreductase [Lachnospiraceae bacterium]|nr:SDR family oxidoreductase [Lachnospiraceae bacterium]